MVALCSWRLFLLTHPKSSGRALNLALLVRAMEKVVTGLTQGDEVIRAITARLSRLDMMHIQDRVFGLAFTPLAAISITEQNILTHVPEAKLRPLLILNACNFRIFDLLEIKLRYLNGGFAHR